MRRLLFLPVVAACTAAAPLMAEPYCKRLPFDEEVPGGLVGKYELVGKDAKTGQGYTGMLEIASIKNTYVLSRTAQGQKLRGEAWVESCSPDEFLVLRVRYESKPKSTELTCYLRFDGDNYTRASCTTIDGRGLEAWYQKP